MPAVKRPCAWFKWIAIAFVAGLVWLMAPLANAMLWWTFNVPCVFCG